MSKRKSGLLLAKDIENTFAMMLISLQLSESGPKAGFFTKAHPFSFTVDSAMHCMRHMKVVINNDSATVTTITCNIDEKDCPRFLDVFMAAGLLHCPSDRTQSRVKDCGQLQPSAKGVHFLQRYCSSNSVVHDPYVTRLLLSSHNSMRSVSLDRQVGSDRLVKSYALAHLLFQRVLGPNPNFYDPANDPDPIPLNTMKSVYSGADRTNEFSLFAPPTPESERFERAAQTSPYAHRYFTHPDSDSHVQYYVSNRGVRLFGERQFRSGPDLKTVHMLPCIVTGHALVQWLMDCTDIVSGSEALELANLFLEHNLLNPIILSPSVSTASRLVVAKDAFYALSLKAWNVCPWPDDIKRRYAGSSVFTGAVVSGVHPEYGATVPLIKPPPSAAVRKHQRRTSLASVDPNTQRRSLQISDSSSHSRPSVTAPPTNSGPTSPTGSGSVRLTDVLNDGGLRLLFREHLAQNRCEENLLFYHDLELFTQTYSNLVRKNNRDVVQANSVLSLVYAIYSRFLAKGAPAELNLNHTIKSRITAAMVRPPGPGPLALLEVVAPLFELAQAQVFKMMETDSLPKFLRSDEYRASMQMMKSWNYSERRVSVADFSRV